VEMKPPDLAPRRRGKKRRQLPTHPPPSAPVASPSHSQTHIPAQNEFSEDNRCTACQQDDLTCERGTICSSCARRGESCVYGVNAPKKIKPRCEPCRFFHNKKCGSERPCAFCVETGNNCIDPSRKGKGVGNRVKRACANCRKDKLQCEEA